MFGDWILKGSPMKKTVFAIGEVLWDLLPDQTLLGGAPFNFTYRIHSLGNNARMISRVGMDDLGRKALEAVRELALATEFIQMDSDHPTGRVRVFFDANHNPDYEIIPDVAYDFMQCDSDLLNQVATADCFCFGTLAQRSRASREAVRVLLEKSSGLKFLDINLRKRCYNQESLIYSLSQADILKLNGDEARQLTTLFRYSSRSIVDFCRRIIDDWALQYCVVTLDERGAFAASSKGQTVYEPGYQVCLRDSLGAGDAFSAGFVHQLLHGGSLEKAVQFGNVLGAIVATQDGATAPISSRDIREFQTREYQRCVHPEFERSESERRMA